MPNPRLSDDLAREAAEAFKRHNGVKHLAWKELGLNDATFANRLKHAALRGMLLNWQPAMPGFEIAKVTTDPNGGQHITQKPEHGPVSVMPETHFLGKMTVNRDPEGRIIQDWVRYEVDDIAREAAMRAAVEAFTSELPRAVPVTTNLIGNTELLNQYTITDYHFGMLSWGEETGADWDLKIAEKLWIDWFTAAVKMSPDAHSAVFAQIGDLLHFDSLKPVTPAHQHVLDADSRFAKIVRTVIRCKRYAIRLLLEKHELVHLIDADANHDEAGGVWLREMEAAHYDDEPRLTVDRSPGSYYAYQWGDVALFYHHGHKKKDKEVDKTFAGRFRKIYGNSKFAYGHTGHLHSDHVFSSELGIKVERHETLAAPSSYEANAGYNSGRSAKVITYHKRFGEVGRNTLTPEMVARPL